MRRLYFILALFAFVGMLLACGTALAQTAQYRMLVDGVHSPMHPDLAAGQHTLSIEMLVTGNVLGEFGGVEYHGGAVQYGFHLQDTQGEVALETETVGFPPTTQWKLTPAEGFSRVAGDVEQPDYLTYEEGGFILPADMSRYGTNYGGSSDGNPPDWAKVAEGNFDWTGELTRLALIPRTTLVYANKGGGQFGAVRAETQGDSTVLGIPEPSTLVLLLCGALALLVRRRRR